MAAPLPAAGGRAPRAGPGGGVPAGRGCVRTRLCSFPASLPPRCSLTLLLEESQKRREVPAHENHHGGRGEGLVPKGPKARGAPPPPEEAQPIVPRRLSPGVCRRGGCRRPPAPSLRPHPHGREDARPGEDAPAQLLVSREQPDPGTAARWQEGTVPAAPTALLGRGRRKEGRGAPPLASGSLPPALPPPPTHGTDHRDPFFQHFPSSSLLDPWDPPGPYCKPVARFHNNAANWEELEGTGRNWEAFPPWAMTQQRQQCHILHPRLSPVPSRTLPGEPHSGQRTRARTGQRVFVLRDGATSRSQGLAALGENQVWDQSNQ